MEVSGQAQTAWPLMRGLRLPTHLHPYGARRAPRRQPASHASPSPSQKLTLLLRSSPFLRFSV